MAGRPLHPGQKAATLPGGQDFESQLAAMGADPPPPIPRRTSLGEPAGDAGVTAFQRFPTQPRPFVRREITYRRKSRPSLGEADFRAFVPVRPEGSRRFGGDLDHPPVVGSTLSRVNASVCNRYTANSVPAQIVTRVRVRRSEEGFGLTIEGPNDSSAAASEQEQGIFVTALKPDGPAQKTGLIGLHMRIIRINGVDFFNETAESAKQAISGQPVVEFDMYLPSDWKKNLTATSIDTPPLQDSHAANPVDEAAAPEQSVYASAHGLHNAVPGGPVAASAHGGAGDLGRPKSGPAGPGCREDDSGTDSGLDRAAAEKLEMERNMVILELIDTEKNYVESLQFMVRIFIDKIRMYDPDKIQIYFSNLEEILEANSNLLEALQVDHASNGANALSKCFNRAIRPFGAYIKYVGHIEFMKKSILYIEQGPKKVSKNKAHLAEIFAEGKRVASDSSLPCSKWALKDLIPLPFQRMLRFPMLVERVIKKTPPSHKDYSHLQKALERLKAVGQEINAQKAKYDFLFGVSENLKEYTGRPLHRLGDLVKYGDVQIRENSGRRAGVSGTGTLSRQGRKTSMAFLFTDPPGSRLVLLMATIKGTNKKGEPVYIAEGTKVLTGDCEILIGDTFDIAVGENFPNAWTVRSNMSIFTLSARTPELRQEWFEKMLLELDEISGVRPIRGMTSEDASMEGADWELNRHQIDWIERLGSGNFGEVWKGNYGHHWDVAIKKMNPGLNLTEFAKEFSVLKSLENPHILILHGVCSEEDPLLIVTEYMDAGNLRDFLSDGLGAMMDLSDLIHIADHIVTGMIYLSSMNVVHRDLRAENVLMGHDENGAITAKVGDFGLARLITNYYQASGGHNFPVKWTAPEAIENGKYTIKSDVWSFGITLYEILTQGKVPYMGMSNDEVLARVVQGRHADGHTSTYRIPCPNSLRFPITSVQNVHNVSMRCWEQLPAHRPSFTAIQSMLAEINTLTNDVGTIPWDALAGFLRTTHTFDESVDVCRGWLQIDGGRTRDVAVTRIKDPQAVLMELAAEEESLLVNISHINVVRFIGLSSGPCPLYAIEEFAYDNGTVLLFLQKTNTVLPVASLANISLQICTGMEFLHTRSGLHHGALCAQNVAYGRTGKCKIGNMLYSRIKNPVHSTHFDRWTAPEVLRSQQSTKEGDVWSFAVLLYELLTMGGQPYSHEAADHKIMDLICSGEKLERPPRAFKAIDSLMLKCLARHPGVRPSFSELKERLRSPNVMNVEEFVVCIQTAWRGYRQRRNFRAIVAQAKQRWVEKMRLLNIWCEFRYKLNIKMMSMNQKEDILDSVLAEVARIRTSVYSITGNSPSVPQVVEAFQLARGDENLCQQVLIHGTGILPLAPGNLPPPRPTAPKPDPVGFVPPPPVGFVPPPPVGFVPPPPVFDVDPLPPPTHFVTVPPASGAVRFLADWPEEQAQSETRKLLKILQRYMVDPGSTEEAANEVLEEYVSDEYIVDFGDRLAGWGWSQDDPMVSPTLASQVVGLLCGLPGI